MKHILIASGSVTHPRLNIDLQTDNETGARADAGKIAKLLHAAGYYRYDLFQVDEGDSDHEIHLIGFRTESAEPTIELGK